MVTQSNLIVSSDVMNIYQVIDRLSVVESRQRVPQAVPSTRASNAQALNSTRRKRS